MQCIQMNKFRRILLARLFNQRHVSYIQGQSPEPKIREYFYYIDHQGMVLRFNCKIYIFDYQIVMNFFAVIFGRF